MMQKCLMRLHENTTTDLWTEKLTKTSLVTVVIQKIALQSIFRFCAMFDGRVIVTVTRALVSANISDVFIFFCYRGNFGVCDIVLDIPFDIKLPYSVSYETLNKIKTLIRIHNRYTQMLTVEQMGPMYNAIMTRLSSASLEPICSSLMSLWLT